MHRIGALLLLSLTLSAGCAYVQSNPPLKTSEAKVSVAKDLPIPEGFKIDLDNSLRHERSSYRRLKLVYRRAEYLSEKQVRAYIKKAYAEAGWELAFVYGMHDTQMIFTRGPEECRVRVFEDFGDRYTEIQIEVEPSASSDAKRGEAVK